MYCLSSFGLEGESSELEWSLFSSFRNVIGFEISVILLHSKLDDYTSKEGYKVNHLTPNGHFSGRTAPLTYKCCILYIYSTNIRTEYFKHAAYSPFFSSSKCRLFHNATFFGVCIIHILYTGCAKI